MTGQFGFTVLSSQLQILKHLAKLSSGKSQNDFFKSFRISAVADSNSINVSYTNFETTAQVKIACMNEVALPPDGIFVFIKPFVDWLDTEGLDNGGTIKFVFEETLEEYEENVHKGGLPKDDPDYKLGEFGEHVKRKKHFHKDYLRSSFSISGNKRQASFKCASYDFPIPEPIYNPKISILVPADKLAFSLDSACVFVHPANDDANTSSAKFFFKKDELFISGMDVSWAFVYKVPDVKGREDLSVSVYPKPLKEAMSFFPDRIKEGKFITLSVSDECLEIAADKIWVKQQLSAGHSIPDVFSVLASKPPQYFVRVDPAELLNKLAFLASQEEFCRFYFENNHIIALGGNSETFTHCVVMDTIESQIPSIGIDIGLSLKKFYQFLKPFAKVAEVLIDLTESFRTELSFSDVPGVRIGIAAVQFENDPPTSQLQLLELGREYIGNVQQSQVYHRGGDR